MHKSKNAKEASFTKYVLLAAACLHILINQNEASSVLGSSQANSAAGGTKTGSHQQYARNIIHNHQSPVVSYQQQHQQQHTTMPPPLITTIAQNNYIDSLASQLGANMKQYQQQQVNYNTIAGSGEQRSPEEHDDSVPLATINNHSRNNQPPVRPMQYVDITGLVGRDRVSNNITSSSSLNNGNSPSNNANQANNSNNSNNNNSGLTAKSRSGLPECATQQVCNAIFVRMNYTQRLCECSSNYNWKCSHNLDPQDGHTIELTRKFDKRIYTQIKTCEPLREVRACKSPTDWTLLALQSERSGKAHYVVVCKCPTWAQLEGPYTHNHPPYANIPGIRVYGMLCAHQTARSSAQTYAAYNPALSIFPEFPWSEALNVLNTTNLLARLDGSSAGSQHN